MCGFAGELCLGHGAADLEAVRQRAARLRHCGPDEAGAVLSADGRCAIAVQRLAGIDPPGSHEPMTSDDGALLLGFNGEIYNFRALREELAAAGARFRTAGETEVLLHLWRRHGEGMLIKLEGMFALALYDAEAGRLLLARDRLGQKPLWYMQTTGYVRFASEAKGLDAGALPIRGESVAAYLTMGYIAQPAAAWAGVAKIPPGHFALARRTLSRPRPYWQPPTRAIQGAVAGGDVVRAVRERLGEAVRALLISDVPLGALLSGGVDSAVVVALMARLADGPVRTFTAGFEAGEYDERPAAREVARHCGTEHTEFLVRPELDGVLDEIVGAYDEPFADSSAIATRLICRAAREHVTVALTGDGGDEAFAGYDRHRAMHLAEGMKPSGYFLTRLLAGIVRPFAPRRERSRLRRLVRFADTLLHPPPMQYFMLRRLFSPADLAELLSEDFAAGLDLEAPQRWFCELYEQGDFDEEVAYAQRHDVMTYLPDDLLVKADIASMSASLKLRSPFLDHRVIELGLSVPAGAKVSGRRGKRILQRAFGELLPGAVFHRRKRGFGVPLAAWLRGPLRAAMQETLLDRSFLDRRIVRRRAIHGLINDHLSGRDDHAHRLWALMVLARWLSRRAGE